MVPGRELGSTKWISVGAAQIWFCFIGCWVHRSSLHYQRQVIRKKPQKLKKEGCAWHLEECRETHTIRFFLSEGNKKMGSERKRGGREKEKNEEMEMPEIF
jgi:hypothetical protein